MSTPDPGKIREIDDKVPADSPGALEIGFTIPQTYNASRILFDNLSRGRGERLALIGPGGTRSYAELCADASRWGHGFQSLGLQRGDRILMFCDDTPAYPAAFFGAVRAGFVPLLINTLTPPDLLQFYLADSGAPVAVADAEFCARFDAAACQDTQLRTLIVVNGGAGEHAVPDALAAAQWLQRFPGELSEAHTHRNEMAFWMYSSGSTGRPKGIVHLQHDMAYSEAAFARNVLKLKPDDICFSVPKIFFAYGFGNSVTFPFSAGAATLLLPGQPKPAAIFEAIERFRPTVFFGLPTLYTSLTKAEGAAATDFSSLRMALSAAEVLSAEVFNGWKKLTGIEIVEGLGSTEALHIYLSNRPEKKKLGAAGLRVLGYEVALKDKDGRAVGDNEEGILWVRGDSNTPLYWNRPDKTAETIREGGWIYTGDRFVRDHDGFHFFRGRADDLIKISGQWVYPLEVELCLAEHPEVRECAVFAVELPDRRMTLKAVVVMNTGGFDSAAATKMLQDYVKASLLPYKYPREIKFLDELPKTGTGKIDRQALMKV
ncbi:benzoate-CoA ligase family protein [Bradyrhizobium sp.]